MEGQRRLLADLDIEEFFYRLSVEDKLVVRGAKVLKEHDVDGTTFMEMTVEDFKEIGVSFGIRKALLRFRKRVLEMEKDLQNSSKVDSFEQMTLTSEPIKVKNKRYSSEPIANIAIAEAAKESQDDLWTPGVVPICESESILIIGEAFATETKVDIDMFTPGVQQRNEYLSSPRQMNPNHSCPGEYKGSASDIFAEPQINPTSRKKGEEDADAVSDRGSQCFEVLDTGPLSFLKCDDLSTEDIKLELDRSKLDIQLDNSSNPKPQLSQASQTSTDVSKSMRLSGESLLGKRRLKSWVFDRKVRWKEQGKQRIERSFMKLRSENEIVLEGYLQMLAGLNSRIKINHWTNRYGILLISGVFLYFTFNRKALFLKGFVDINYAQRIEIPQTDISENALKLEICLTTRKRYLLAFTTESELLIWRNELLQIVTIGGGDDSEQDSLICLE